MTAPGTILVAKMLVPETEVPATMGTVHIPKSQEHSDENLLGSIARGTIDGGQLAFNVAIMLISFLALVGLLNAIMLDISNFAWGAWPYSFSALPELHPGGGRRSRRLVDAASRGARPTTSATCWAPAPCLTSS